jgi:hypothetical protein
MPSIALWLCACLVALIEDLRETDFAVGTPSSIAPMSLAGSLLVGPRDLTAMHSPSGSEDSSLLGSTLKIESASAGQSVRLRVLGDGKGRHNLRGTVKRRDGSRVDLPVIDLTLPLHPPTFEGPRLPPGCAGGTLVLELVDAETGNVVDTGVAPIG